MIQFSPSNPILFSQIKNRALVGKGRLRLNSLAFIEEDSQISTRHLNTTQKKSSLIITPSWRDFTGASFKREQIGKLSFNSNPKEWLNCPVTGPSIPIESREIFKGYYEGDIVVAIQKVLHSEETIREIVRECQILRPPENQHENLIRYFCNEKKKEFV